MKRVVIIRLKVENFKGIRSYELDLDGKCADIFGANASGKSSLADAWCWLLFGKDSHGSADFSVKPLGEDGEVLDHGAQTTVSAQVGIDGKTVALKRVYYEKWTQKRGKPDATYDGNTTDYYIDDVPVKKGDFDKKIEQLIAKEDTFIVLTRLNAFCEQVNWQSRRQLLLDMAGAKSDIELMAQDERFADLVTEIGDGTLDDAKKRLASRRKLINADKNALPKRIDEIAKMAEGLSGRDYGQLRIQLEDAKWQKQEADSKFVRLTNGSELATTRARLAEVDSEINALKAENDAHRAKCAAEIDNRDKVYEAKIREAETKYLALSEKSSRLELDIAEYEQRRQQLKDRYRAEYAKTIPGERLYCPTCKREYDEASRRAAEDEWNLQRQERLDKIVADGKEIAVRLEKMKKSYCELDGSVEAAKAEWEQLKSAFIAVKRDTVIVNIDKYDRDLAPLLKRSDELKREYAALQNDAETEIDAVRHERTRLSNLIDMLTEQLSAEGMLENLKARREELEAAAKDYSQQLEDCDRLLYLADEFVRHKVATIEDDINSHFQLARFKLFDTQVNGAIVDCCEATYNGVPYSDVNSAMRANLGVDIIAAISQHYELAVPLFCDNAESVSEYQPIDTQVIRLYVSPEDKKLRSVTK